MSSRCHSAGAPVVQILGEVSLPPRLACKPTPRVNSGHPGCVWQRLSSDQLECAGFHREGRNGTIKAGAPWDAGSTVNSQPIKSNWLCSGLIVSYTACIGSSSTVIALQRGQESEGSAVTAQDMGSRHVSKKKTQEWGKRDEERKEGKKKERKR